MKKKYIWLFLSIIAYVYVCVLTFKITSEYISLLINGELEIFIQRTLPTIWNLFVCWCGHYSSTTLGKKLLNELVNELRKRY